eukprot:104794-Prorocentrum_lima.AAC.1
MPLLGLQAGYLDHHTVAGAGWGDGRWRASCTKVATCPRGGGEGPVFVVCPVGLPFAHKAPVRVHA